MHLSRLALELPGEMKNGEAEWPNDWSARWAVTSHVGKSSFCASSVQVLVLIFFFFGNCSVGAWFALARATFLRGFSRQSKGKVAPLPLGLNLLWLLWKFCFCCANAFEWLYALRFLPFCCSRVFWNSWRNAFGAHSPRRWGPICGTDFPENLSWKSRPF